MVANTANNKNKNTHKNTSSVFLSWSADIEQDGRVVFDAPLILNFLAIM